MFIIKSGNNFFFFFVFFLFVLFFSILVFKQVLIYNCFEKLLDISFEIACRFLNRFGCMTNQPVTPCIKCCFYYWSGFGHFNLFNLTHVNWGGCTYYRSWASVVIHFIGLRAGKYTFLCKFYNCFFFQYVLATLYVSLLWMNLSSSIASFNIRILNFKKVLAVFHFELFTRESHNHDLCE